MALLLHREARHKGSAADKGRVKGTSSGARRAGGVRGAGRNFVDQRLRGEGQLTARQLDLEVVTRGETELVVQPLRDDHLTARADLHGRHGASSRAFLRSGHGDAVPGPEEKAVRALVLGA